MEDVRDGLPLCGELIASDVVPHTAGLHKNAMILSITSPANKIIGHHVIVACPWGRLERRVRADSILLQKYATQRIDDDIVRHNVVVTPSDIILHRDAGNIMLLLDKVVRDAV